MGEKISSEEILAAVRASGYLMEQEVATILEALDFHVQTNRAYNDIDERKSREIDVWAICRLHHDRENQLSVFVELICECKNSRNPFVFLTRGNQVPDSVAPLEYIFPVGEYLEPLPGSPNVVTIHQAFFHLNLDRHHFRFTQPRRAVQFAKIVKEKGKWEANHGGLYDAMFYPLVKAMIARKQEIFAHQRDTKVLWLFFPIVITSGELYEIDTTSASGFTAMSVDHVSMTREIKAEKFAGRFNIDFVTETALSNFVLEKINPFVHHVVDLARTDPKALKDAGTPSKRAGGVSE